MYDYVIIHGSYGNPFENWFPWLFDELSKRDKNVLAPQFPCGAGIQNYENWKHVMESYVKFIGKDTTFIGHSLSPAFIVDFILEKKLHVKNLVFAAPFYGKINIPDFDEVNVPFFIRNDLDRVKEYVDSATCFISQNDPYVPNQLSVDFAEKIGAKKILVKDAGHFNTSAGYSHFEQLLKELI